MSPSLEDQLGNVLGFGSFSNLGTVHILDRTLNIFHIKKNHLGLEGVYCGKTKQNRKKTCEFRSWIFSSWSSAVAIEGWTDLKAFAQLALFVCTGHSVTGLTV